MIRQARLIAAIGTVLMGAAAVPPDTAEESRVVFVCEHGAAKSIIAAAHFNKIARERGMNIRAVARGTNPDPYVAPKVVAGLRSEGVTEITEKPQLVTKQDTSDAKRVVTLGCKLPHKAKATDWNEVPSPSADYAAASTAIRSRVETLLDEISAAERAGTK